MSIFNFILILFGIFFSKELIAANEERIIVSSLVIVLLLGLEFFSQTVKEELDNSALAIFDEIKSYMVIYYGIVKAFEKLCIQRNMFLNLFFQGLLLSLNQLRLVLTIWVSFAESFMFILLFHIVGVNLTHKNEKEI
jgi:hypothetical protein